MGRIVIKHLSGSKANQEASFPLDQIKEISFGRDAASNVAYDAERDDAVSRNHAKIARDPAQDTLFVLTDLGSRNGVFVNQAKIAGSTALHHGDVVQLGTGGPEFSFQIDPPPALAPKATRQIDLRQAAPTREISVGADSRPQRVVLKHLSGSKANQEVTFPVAQTSEISFGRDPASSVSYDAERDDTVSRNHATIKRDPQQNSFTLIDLNSRNGVNVNGARINGNVVLHHGDVIQFGAGGPEISFQLDPAPANALRATRQFEGREAPPAMTREAPAVAATAAGTSASAAPTLAAAPRGVGKETVERLITETKVESRKSMVNIVAALVAVVAVVAGVFVFMGRETEKKLEATTTQIQAAKTQSEATASTVKAMQDIKTPQEIAAAYSESTVYIEVSWKLIDVASGQQLYHRYVNGKAAYLKSPAGGMEPWLTVQAENSKPIGGSLSGSGFAVTANGFILTNRHVAAPWKETFELPPGIRIELNQKGELVKVEDVPAQRWSAEKSVWWPQALRGEQKPVAGRHDRLDVTFANNKLRIPAKLVRVSEEHDVALIKVDTPAAVKPTPLLPASSYDEVKPGNAITVLGYPGISPKTLFAARSKDMLDPGGMTIVDIPIPTVTPGAVGKVIRSTPTSAGEGGNAFYSERNSYQLTANATGAGNSGGPVFDDRGRVIGIFYAGNQAITFAVPIKFATELMEVKAMLQ
ncbi:FHA domain-containing protein [Accumulibacter sp.]|uniref:FHA domain-containing protein n=1 Tax=Accumulibacter sp. TaxID=2053492 RepID=UPI0026244501|nr:FHA domain-containing protein [Accumulibacter sp.]